MAPGLLETGGVHLSRKFKKILAYRLAGMIERVLSLKEEGNERSLATAEPEGIKS